MSEAELTATIHPTTASIPAVTWNALLPSTSGKPDNPFLDHAFFLALEQSGSATARTGWQPQHIVLERDGSPVALMPLYLKSHSQGEYVFDYAWADAYQRAGSDYYPKLQSSVPFTPVTAPKLLVPSADPALKRALLTTAETLARQRHASSVHATFVPEAEADLAGDAGWLHRVDTQYHWHNEGFASFEEFLGTLSSRHRKITRRERRDALGADGLTVRWITGADIQEHHWDEFFAFYQDTGSRKWGRPYLTRSFFSLLSASMADRVVLMFAYDGDRAVAGTLNLLGSDTLYGRYWGAIEDVPFLHFELCYYQAIDFAIAHKLKTVEAGAQGEHKLARGYVPTPTHSIHWIEHPALRQAIADYLSQERTAVLREQHLLDEMTPFKKQ